MVARIALLLAAALTACGAPDRTDEPAGQAAPTTTADRPSADAAECEAASDCHYDDPCMATDCQPEPTPNRACSESFPPPGPCICHEGRCEMQVDATEADATETEPTAATSCTSDEGCFYDFVCMPTECTTTPPPENLACAESRPAPGPCRCISGTCVMQRPAGDSEASCSDARPCGFRAADGTCAPGQPNEELTAGPGEPTPVCRCAGAGARARCQLDWRDPVPCRSVDDCWVTHDGAGPHPIARPANRRGRPFEPCADGAFAPVCTQGYCAVDPRGPHAC